MKTTWQPVSPETAKAHPLYGIKGWLLVFAILNIFTLAVILVAGIFIILDPTRANTAILFISFLCVVQCIPCYLLFSKHSKFRHITSLLFLIVTIYSFGIAAASSKVSIILDQIPLILSSVIWITYLQKSKRVRVTFEQSIPINEVIQTEKHENTDQSPLIDVSNTISTPTATKNLIKYGPWVFSSICIIVLLSSIFQLDRDNKKNSVVSAPITSPAAIATQKPIETVVPSTLTSTNVDEFVTLKKDSNPLSPNHPINYFSIKNIDATPKDQLRSRYEYWMKNYATEFLTETGIHQYKQEASRHHPNGFGLTECIGYWTFIGKSVADNDFYIDQCTLKSLGKYRAMWSLNNYVLSQTNTIGRSYLSSKYRRVYDCANDRTAMISLSQFEKDSGEGVIVNSVSIKESDWDFEDVLPNSIGAKELREACNLPTPK